MAKKIDLISSIILFFLGLGILLKSLSYPLGSFRSPGGGLFPLLASILLILLSVSLGIQAFLRKNGIKTDRVQFFPSKDSPKKVLLGLISLVGFRYLLPIIGFGPSTFLFILFLTKFLGNYNWKISIIFATCSAICSYYLFQIWLKIPMPVTILKI